MTFIKVIETFFGHTCLHHVTEFLAFAGLYIVVFSEEVVGGAEADVRNFSLARSWIELEAIGEQKKRN